MNKELIYSLLKKALPVITTYAIGRGWINDVIASKIPDVLDAVVLIVSFIPTVLASIKTHGTKV